MASPLNSCWLVHHHSLSLQLQMRKRCSCLCLYWKKNTIYAYVSYLVMSLVIQAGLYEVLQHILFCSFVLNHTKLTLRIEVYNNQPVGIKFTSFVLYNSQECSKICQIHLGCDLSCLISNLMPQTIQHSTKMYYFLYFKQQVMRICTLFLSNFNGAINVA